MLPNFIRQMFGSSDNSLVVPGRKSGTLLILLLRGIFGVVIIGCAVIAFRYFSENETIEKVRDNLHKETDPGKRKEISELLQHLLEGNDPTAGYVAFGAVILVGVGIVATDVLIRNKQITTLSAVYFGLLLGLMLGYILSTAVGGTGP